MSYKRQDKREGSFLIEVWIKASFEGGKSGWWWIAAFPSVEGARARAEWSADKLGLAYRVVDGDGKEQGRWTGTKL